MLEQALNYDSFLHYEFIACGCLSCCNASAHRWQDSTFAYFHWLPVVDWAVIFFSLHEGHVKCAEQKQNTLHCNSLEYCVPFMQVAWQLLPSLYWATVWICVSPTFPWSFVIFIHETPNLFITAKHCSFLLTGPFISVPSFLPPQLSQDTSFFYDMLSCVMPHSILNVLHKEALLQRLLNTISGPDCDLDFAYP